MLPGADLAAQLVKEKRLPPLSGGDDDPYRPSFGWARADKTGTQWLVSLGTDQYRGAGHGEFLGHRLSRCDGQPRGLHESMDHQRGRHAHGGPHRHLP
jgi:hypothetical protein